MKKENDLTINYVLNKNLKEALAVAEITKRPLLIKGEPGTGKTLLAAYLAKEKNYPLFEWHIKSTSLAKDGLYFYDAVTRLNEAKFGDESARERIKNIRNYIRLGALGNAFVHNGPSVVLIDEIDKADIEFPNDLLLELDRMEFTILETDEKIVSKNRPLTIITSNNEKELPDAFLRRCIFHYIDFPDYNFMQVIVNSHFPNINSDLLKHSLDEFYKMREMNDLKKRPTTSELIDWIRILIHQGTSPKEISSRPFLGTLIKNEEDFNFFTNSKSRV